MNKVFILLFIIFGSVFALVLENDSCVQTYNHYDFVALASLTPISADSCEIEVNVIYKIYEKEPGRYSTKFTINQCFTEKFDPNDIWTAHILRHSFPAKDDFYPWIKKRDYKNPVFFFMEGKDSILYLQTVLFREGRIEGEYIYPGEQTSYIDYVPVTCDKDNIGFGYSESYLSYLHSYGTPYENKKYKFEDIDEFFQNLNIDEKKLDEFLRTNRKPIIISKIQSSDYAVGTIFHMQEKDSLCEIHYTPETIWKKKGGKIETKFLNESTFGAASKALNQDSLAVKKGACFDTDKYFRTMYLFGEKKEGIFTIDSILSTYDVFVHNDDLIDMRMGISFDDFMDALMPSAFNAAEYRYYAFYKGYHLYEEITAETFPEKHRKEMIEGATKVENFCKERNKK